MLTVDMQEKLRDEVTIVEAPNVVEMMIKFMYDGKVDGLEENADILLPIADKYDLKDLKVACEIALIHQLSTANCLDILILADTYSASELKRWSLQFIAQGVGNVVVHPKWRDKMRLYPDLLMDIISLNCYSMEHVKE